jgi:hypothetical protein
MTLYKNFATKSQYFWQGLTGFSEQAELAGFSLLSEVFYMTNLQIYFKTSAASAYLGLKVFRKLKVWTKLSL